MHGHGASNIDLNIWLATLKFARLFNAFNFSLLTKFKPTWLFCISAYWISLQKKKIDQLLLHCTCNRVIFFRNSTCQSLPIFFSYLYAFSTDFLTVVTRSALAMWPGLGWGIPENTPRGTRSSELHRSDFVLT